VPSEVVKEYRGVKRADALDTTAVALASPPARRAPSKLVAGKTKDIRDAAARVRAIHQKKIALGDSLRESPVQVVALIQPVPLALERNLYPDLERSAEELLELDNFNAVRDVWPIVVPANDAVALLRVVTVRSEAAGPELELDPDPFLTLAGVAIRDAVREARTDFLDSKLQPLGDVTEEEHDAQLVPGSVLERCVLEQRGSVQALHHGKMETDGLCDAWALRGGVLVAPL
jgi:hypothetical protein